MYIYIQKRISPIEFYLPNFHQQYFFINLVEHLRIIFFLQNINLFFIKNINLYLIINIYLNKYLLLKCQYSIFQLVTGKQIDPDEVFTIKITEIHEIPLYTSKKFFKYLKFYKFHIRKKNLKRMKFHNKKIYNNKQVFIFTYLLSFIFKPQIYLFKSIYLFQKLPVIKDTFKMLIQHTKYLLQKPNYFQYLIAITLIYKIALTSYFLTLLAYYLQSSYKHKKHIFDVKQLLLKNYCLNPQIQGVKLIIKGPFERHGRTQTFVQRIGKIKSFNNYDNCFLYDKIPCIGIYGVFNLKLQLIF